MSKKLIAACLVLSAFATSASAGFYNPYGPQQDVALATVTGGGWTQCYASQMHVAIGSDARNVLSQCSGDYLMMAGRRTGETTFTLLAQASFADVTFNTGSRTQNTHNANGSDWYFGNNWSWGFVEAGDDVWLGECDVTAGARSMCLHTMDFTGGFRIGDTLGMNFSPSYEKVFFVSNGDIAADVPEPASIGLLGLGLLGIGAARRRANKA